MAKKDIKSEKELSDWFIKNYEKLGYSEIVKDNNGRFPDFTMQKKGKSVGVELETLSSNFILHKHDKTKVDEVVCIKKDKEIGVKMVDIPDLNFNPRLRRISFTVDPEVKIFLQELVKEGTYRNMSHAVETAIREFRETNKDE